MTKSVFSNVKNRLSRSSSTSSTEKSPTASYPGRSTMLSPSGKTPVIDEAPPAYSEAEPSGVAGSLSRLNIGSARGSSPAPSLDSVTKEDDKYAFLSSFDTIFVIDDSGSMRGDSWREVKQVLETITPICTSHDKDGIDLYFLNHRSREPASDGMAGGGYTNVRSASTVQRIFDLVQPYGGTPTGTRLESILKDYVKKFGKARDPQDVKPINIIVITDGRASDDPESVIIHHARKLDKLDAPLYQVGIQFFQVGRDPTASKALAELDDELSATGVRDMVDTVSFDSQNSFSTRSLSADGILKVVLGAVVRRLDRKQVSNNGRSRT